MLVSPALGNIDIGPGEELGKTAWGEPIHREFDGWELSDIAYVQPKGWSGEEMEDSVMVGYRRDSKDGFYVRFDFADLSSEELAKGYPVVEIFPAERREGETGLMGRLTGAFGWDRGGGDRTTIVPNKAEPAAFWSHELDAVEAFVPSPQWAEEDIGVRVRWREREVEIRLPKATVPVVPAQVAVIAHANQPVTGDNGRHLQGNLTEGGVISGLHLLLDTHQSLGFPVNLHLGGGLLASLSWLRQNPQEPSYPRQDGKHFLGRLKNAVAEGWGEIIGGVMAEHIMPYFEGQFNTRSMRAYADVAKGTLSLPPEAMTVMHIPERVMHADASWRLAGKGPYSGNPFADIIAGGYKATYLDEVTHLHHWFYPDEHLSPSWTEWQSGRWSGSGGDDDEPHQHKLHRVNGVLCFVINDREDAVKFSAALEKSPHQDAGRGIPRGLKWPLLDKATSGDPFLLTVLFDDWEAFAGNSFDGPPNDNALRWHRTARWMVARPWIRGRLLGDVAAEAESNPRGWVVEHGEVKDKPLMTYEWLLRATEHSYDNWYFGSPSEESFSELRPAFSPDGALRTPYRLGDLSDGNSLLGKTWETVRPRADGDPVSAGESGIFAMSYETAWHDEDMPHDSYQSRNYQATFNRPELGSTEDTTPDKISGWARNLAGHIRDAAVLQKAEEWAKRALGSGAQKTEYVAEDVDMDGDEEFVMRNDKVFAVVEKWGARMPVVFAIRDGRAVPVVGVQVSEPVGEGEGEAGSATRISAFRDEFGEAGADSKYIDMPYRVSCPETGVEAVSDDGAVEKSYSLDGDLVMCRYQVKTSSEPLKVRFGLSPDWPFLMLNGQEAMESERMPDGRRVKSASGVWAEVRAGGGVVFTDGELPRAGHLNRRAPMTEQVEAVLPAGGGEIGLSVGVELPLGHTPQ